MKTKKQNLEAEFDRLTDRLSAAIAAQDDHAVEEADIQLEIIRTDINKAVALAETLKVRYEEFDGNAGAGFENALETFGDTLEDDPEFWQFAIDSAQMLNNG